MSLAQLKRSECLNLCIDVDWVSWNHLLKYIKFLTQNWVVSVRWLNIALLNVFSSWTLCRCLSNTNIFLNMPILRSFFILKAFLRTYKYTLGNTNYWEIYELGTYEQLHYKLSLIKRTDLGIWKLPKWNVEIFTLILVVHSKIFHLWHKKKKVKKLGYILM